MAKKGGNPQNLKPFPKGKSGNEGGRPKNLLTKAKLDQIISRFYLMTRAELKAVGDDPKASMLEIHIASIMAQGSKTGDYSRLNALLDRYSPIGKVKETTEIIMPKPTIVKRLDGSQLVLASDVKSED